MGGPSKRQAAAAPPRLWLQRDPEVRRFLLRYHIPTLIQVAIIAYVASGWQYFRKVCVDPSLFVC